MALVISNVSKSFPGVKALDDVSLTLRPGEIHAIMGENGAGKSTLIKAITGVHQPTSGTLTLDGQQLDLKAPSDAIALGISAVHQERNLVPRFTVAENILLERPPLSYGLVDFKAAAAEAQKFIDMLGVDIDPLTEVRNLSVAQMQVVEIAKALSQQAKVLLLDEPTASITENETRALFTLLRQLRDAGTAIVFVSHKLEEVFEISDKISVLRDGQIAAADIAIGDITRAKLVSLMIGRDERPIVVDHRVPDRAEVVLELENITTEHGHLNVKMVVRKGEVLGLYGLVGAGRSELAHAILGEARITGGTLKLHGNTVNIRDMHEALHRFSIGYLSEDRKQEGLILIHPIRSNIAISIWDRLAGAFGLITAGRERKAAKPLAEKLDIRTPSLEQITGNLSGGNQQKVSLAKWLAANVELLIIDEPTVGIDIKTKAYIHELISSLAADGVAIILISSDMPEVVALADCIGIMHDMQIASVLDNNREYADMSDRIMTEIHNSERKETT